jgi:phosphatidylinositol glycan class B
MHCIIWTIGDYHCYMFVRQIIDKKTAQMTILSSVTSQFVQFYVLRTSANGIEGNLMYVVFYYILNIKPVIFDKCLTILTAAITLSFSIRSSSLIGYIPLALMVIWRDTDFFIPILISGITIAVPMVVLNVCSDAYFYGYWTFPQYNFVYLNVVEGLSEYFGTSPWYYHMRQLTDEFCEIESYGFQVFVLMSIRQVFGTLSTNSGNGW